MPQTPRKSKPVVKKGVVVTTSRLSPALKNALKVGATAAAVLKMRQDEDTNAKRRASRAAKRAKLANQVGPFAGRAFAYTYEIATGQVVTRGDSACRDKHPYNVRDEYLAAEEHKGATVVLLSWHEIPVTDYDVLVKILNGTK